MTISKSLVALSAALSAANAAFQGFNYGAAFTNGAVKTQADFESEFEAAQNLDGTNGAFNSARLYTMVQGGTPNDPISAIPAAIKTKTNILFGLWASAGDDAFKAELEALQKTIDQYCDQLDGLVAGISVGSEDLYRISPTGIANGEYAGAEPNTLVRYIGLVRDAVKGSCLSGAPIGHVDTWTAYDNSSNSAVIEASDWLGMNAFAYFENTKPNSIEDGASNFQNALDRTQAAAGGKDVWITETGWPVSGKDFGQAVAGTKNARTFYEDVGCPRFGKVNLFWYTLRDAAPDTPSPSFGIIPSDSTKPLYDLSCDGSDTDPTTSSTSSKPASSTTTESTEEPTSETTEKSTEEPTEKPTSDEPVPEPTTSESEPEPTTTTTHSHEPEPEPTSSESDSPAPEPTTDAESSDESTPVPTTVPEESTVIDTPVPEPTDSVTTTPIVEPAPTQPITEQPTTTPSGTTDGGSPPTSVPAGSARLNSMGAAVVAVLLAVGFF